MGKPKHPVTSEFEKPHKELELLFHRGISKHSKTTLDKTLALRGGVSSPEHKRILAIYFTVLKVLGLNFNNS